jgi:hypothetical protein
MRFVSIKGIWLGNQPIHRSRKLLKKERVGVNMCVGGIGSLLQ